METILNNIGIGIAFLLLAILTLLFIYLAARLVSLAVIKTIITSLIKGGHYGEERQKEKKIRQQEIERENKTISTEGEKYRKECN